MMTRKRKIGLLLVSVIISSMIGVIIVSAKTNGKPFDEIWGAITVLQTRVDDHDADIVNIYNEVLHEGLKVEVHVLKYDTQTEYSPYPLYSTQVGGTDRKSGVYLHITFRGQNVDATNLWGDVIDGGKYYWSGSIEELETGIYRSRWNVVSGVAAGSYLVDLTVIYTVDTGPYADTYYGKAIYTIDCTATTT